jgi:phosphatidylglycerophosphatase A
MNLPEPRWAAQLPAKWVTAIATLGPLGHNRHAPGTWGSLAGLLYTMAFFRTSRAEVVLVWTLLAAWLAVSICGEAERRFGQRDPGKIVLDEFIVMPIVFLGWRTLPATVWPEPVVWLLGFALFRLFDIVKPFGIARLQRWPGGWGVVADDFAAAVAACGAMHAVAVLWRFL